jgi:hypothetical protein
VGVIQNEGGNSFPAENTLSVENSSVVGQTWTIRAGKDMFIRPSSFVVGRHFEAAFFCTHFGLLDQLNSRADIYNVSACFIDERLGH